jgi:hypothetical protein
LKSTTSVDFSRYLRRCFLPRGWFITWQRGLEIKKGCYSAALFVKLDRVLAVQNVHRDFETETHIGKLGFAPGHGYLQLEKVVTND